MHRRTFARFALATLVASAGFFALSSPAFAQRSVPVTVENDAQQPIPVYQTGRTPYQLTYFVSTSAIGEDCDPIPVPDGMMLTITSVGVDAQIHQSDTPDVYLASSRSTGGGGAVYRFGAELKYQSSYSSWNYYAGIYNTTLHVGPAGGPVSYAASICVSGTNGGSNAVSGVVSGYVEPAVTIIDGNSLP